MSHEHVYQSFGLRKRERVKKQYFCEWKKGEIERGTKNVTSLEETSYDRFNVKNQFAPSSVQKYAALASLIFMDRSSVRKEEKSEGTRKLGEEANFGPSKV